MYFVQIDQATNKVIGKYILGETLISGMSILQDFNNEFSSMRIGQVKQFIGLTVLKRIS